MGIRRKARELALQALFCMDMTGDTSEDMLQRFCDHYVPPAKARPFFLELIRGVIGSRALIDQLIERFSRNWRLSRMSCVDRNIMRIAAYEMLFCGDIPAKVSINEAIDIGKKIRHRRIWRLHQRNSGQRPNRQRSSVPSENPRQSPATG